MKTNARYTVKRCVLLFTALFVMSYTDAVSAKAKIVKNELVSAAKKRNYYLFVPETITQSKPAPLIVMLHGSGRDGRILVEHWQELAARENIIIAGPDATDRAGWNVPADGPGFLHDLVEELKAKHLVDARRVYLFGHSAGAVFGIYMSLLESQYFAAAAVHAGALRDTDERFIAMAERKIPISLIVGTNDAFFPLPNVRRTRDLLANAGLPVELTEIPKHNHYYYGRSKEINAGAWEFLKKHKLEVDPQYKEHRFR